MTTQKESRVQIWLPSTEWMTLVSIIIGVFLFVYHQTVHLNERLDSHITQINQRADDLHKEFYELLKEMRK